jgi:hypothetical protein
MTVAAILGGIAMSNVARNEMMGWQAHVLRQLADFLVLPERSDFEWRVRKPTSSAYRAAVDLITDIQPAGIPQPRVAPDREGGIQFEWDKGKYSLEIGVTPSGAYEFLETKGPDAEEEGFIGIVGARELVMGLSRQ